MSPVVKDIQMLLVYLAYFEVTIITGGLTPKIRQTYRTNVPAVGRQRKNLCSYRTYVPMAGGQQKNQPSNASLM